MQTSLVQIYPQLVLTEMVVSDRAQPPAQALSALKRSFRRVRMRSEPPSGIEVAEKPTFRELYANGDRTHDVLAPS